MKNDAEIKKKLIEELKKTPIVQIACLKVNISRATYYRWRKDDKKFSRMTDKAILDGSLLINDLAESQLISAIKDKNITSLIFWLKNHHPTYATRIEVMAHLKSSSDESLTPEQQTLVKKALKLANLPNKLNKNNE